MLNVAPQKERIPDHLRAMAEQDDKSAASGKTGEQSSIGVGCAPGEERDSAISICAVHSATVTAPTVGALIKQLEDLQAGKSADLVQFKALICRMLFM